MKNALKSLEQEVILSWKSVEKLQSDFCTNPVLMTTDDSKFGKSQ